MPKLMTSSALIVMQQNPLLRYVTIVLDREYPVFLHRILDNVVQDLASMNFECLQNLVRARRLRRSKLG